MTSLATHPLPWSDVHGRLHLTGTLEGWDDDGALITMRMGSRIGDGTFAPKTRTELAALRDRIDAVLTAPYRLYVAGGDTVDAAREWPVLYEWLDNHLAGVTGAGWHLQLVTGPENPAQALVYTWALARRVEVIGSRPLRFNAGGCAVALMPTVHGRALAVAARKEHGMPVYRMPPHERWGGGRA